MKFKKLTLHNLASIEQATIDFEHGPLAQESIFLICGDTGSGKTTLLDAICLALYRQSPRFASAPNTKYFLGENEIQNRDVVQILRENTLEGWSTLEFTGNDGVDYTASWNARRPSRNLSRKAKVSWSLSWFESGREIILGKVGEIEDRINLAVGLTFEQFCRTSMLAQGEFTRFLKSGDKEKAEILEKLTDTHQYVEIGSRIFETAKAWKNECELLEAEMKGIRLLSEEETNLLKENASRLESSILLIDKQLYDNQQNSIWVETLISHMELVAKAESEFKEKEEILQTSRYLESKKTLERWDNSRETRILLEEYSQVQKNMQNYQDEKKILSQEFSRLLGAQKGQILQKEELVRQHQRNAEEIASMQKGEPMYRQAQTCMERLKKIGEDRHRREGLKARFQKGTSLLEEECRLQKCQEEELSKIHTELAVLENRILQNRAEMEKYPVSELQKQHSLLLERLSHWSNLELLSNECLAKEKETDNLSGKLVEIRKQLTDLSGQLHQAALEKEVAEKELESEQKRIDAVRDSVSEGARMLRAGLKIGNPCPVCGKTVSQEVFDTAFDGIYASLLAVTQEKRQKKDACLQKWQALQIQCSTIEANLSPLENSLSTLRLQTGTLLEKLKSEMSALGLIWEGPGRLSEEISILKKADINRKDILQKQLEDIEKTNQEYQSLLGQKNEIAERLGKAGALLSAHQARQKSYRETLNQIEEEISLTETRIEQETKALEDKIILEDWKRKSEENLTELVGEISRLAQKWQTLHEKALVLEQQRQYLSEESVRTEKLIENIREACPEWKFLPVSDEYDPKNLSEKLSGFLNRLQILLARTSETANREKTLSTTLETYFKTHPGENKEELFMLSARKDIHELRMFCENAVHAHQMAASLLKSRKADYQKHWESQKQTSLSQISFQDTEPSGHWEQIRIQLTAESDRLKTERDQAQRQLGENRSRLELDFNNRKLVGQRQQELDLKKAGYEKWDRLNRLLGDAQGSTFQMIAQSFIMHQLLVYANQHLSRLSDRYSLECAPGTLSLMVRDLKDGGTLRSCSGLSGGESFQVSLALALGLSGFGGTRTGCDILFIDEGFGTLSGEPLNLAIETLSRLQQHDGRRVGIISHVASLRERISTQIRVEKVNPTRSDVTVIS